jgi:hypothetical protein
MFRKLNLFPFSGDGRKTPTQLDHLGPPRSLDQVRCVGNISFLSPEDRMSPSFLEVVFRSSQTSGRCTKTTNSVVLSVTIVRIFWNLHKERSPITRVS